MTDLNKPVNLLWTGGWDSTFRLIQLVLIYKKSVQPYYIIDHKRNSSLHELRAMVSIKEALAELDKDTKTRILPTILKGITEIKEDKSVTGSYKNLLKREKIGIQYEWLSRYCREEGISNMEICNMNVTYEEENHTKRLLGNNLERIETDFGAYYKLSNKCTDKDLCNVYRNFAYPVLDVMKKEMFEISKENGFENVMKLTWFCHMPTRFSKPCGKCPPCRIAYHEGLKWRLPAAAKFRYHTWPTLRKMARFLGIYKKLKWMYP